MGKRVVVFGLENEPDTVGESSFWFLIGQYKILKDIGQEKIFDSGKRWKRMPLALV
jgi:hypothetical protein